MRSSAAFLGPIAISESVHRRATTRDAPPARSAWRRGVERCPYNRARSTKATPPADLPTLPSRDSNGYTLPLRCTPPRSAEHDQRSGLPQRPRLASGMVNLLGRAILEASITRDIVSGCRGWKRACRWSGRNTQAVRRNLCSARRSAITCPKVGNSESERCRRRGKTRQVMKNQRSDGTRRRSRDMRVIITLGSNPMIQNSRSSHSEPQRNAKSAYLCATPLLRARKAGDVL